MWARIWRSTGASALEVLNNVPSVNVSIEGQISLRGSAGVQILIDGKPSVMADQQGNALGTITADMIESIEVITNPSAKYDAEGTSGILNIILKKEEKKGMNGSVTLNTGIPDNHSVGVSLNRRTEKFNLFTQLGVGYPIASPVFGIHQPGSDQPDYRPQQRDGVPQRNFLQRHSGDGLPHQSAQCDYAVGEFRLRSGETALPLRFQFFG